MWSREELKARAKLILKFNYWKTLVFSLVISIFTNGSGVLFLCSIGIYIFNVNKGQYPYDGSSAIILLVPIYILVIGAMGIAFFISVVGPLQVSSKKYYIAQREQPGDILHIVYGFTGGNHFDCAKAMAWSYLFTWLWSLLFIIPGIVKRYTYRLIPYILAENPDMNYRQAMKLSINMTQGIKWDMFIMDLSFIGWNLLGFMLCGVGIFFVHPYYETTIAEMYVFIRERAITLNICPRETFMPNFGQTPPTYPSPIF